MFYGQHTSVFRVLFCVVLFVATERILAADSPSVTGLWKNEDASFEVYEENGKLNAKIVSLREPLAPDGRQKTDIHNPDAGKHSRPILGMVFMTGFTSTGSGKWGNGTIYDPKSGNTYSCNMELQGTDTLKVRGYIGVSLIGRTETWKRAN
ncbi:MAG TPA: DUF2147 domain-containing protein [Chthoniobacterales bacterium]|jgi:uncharacterized protein (DUF2147 family)|nr:DUF2147 domain-containing protein [Chthoniobacterales bacterium]